jgi:DNA ligase-1
MCTMPPPNDKPEPPRAKRAPRTLGLKVGVWNGEALQGPWQISRKLDGVCVIVTSTGAAISRAGKPLHNVPTDALPWGSIYECYLGSWEKSVSALRTKKGTNLSLISRYFYSLSPVDARLSRGVMMNPTAPQIVDVLANVLAHGDEGLVLQQGDVRLKVKPKVTYDVHVTGIIMGRGKHAGRMGALITPMGKVGTGFSDMERLQFAGIADGIASGRPGPIIEVECMGLTPSGKFRHARYLRVRWDK